MLYRIKILEGYGIYTCIYLSTLLKLLEYVILSKYLQFNLIKI